MSAVAITLVHPKTGAIRTVQDEGRPVAPGLAVTPAYIDDEAVPGRWSLTHLASGQAVAMRFCAHRIDDAARIAIASGVDWTRGRNQLAEHPPAPQVGALCRVMNHLCDACWAVA